MAVTSVVAVPNPARTGRSRPQSGPERPLVTMLPPGFATRRPGFESPHLHSAGLLELGAEYAFAHRLRDPPNRTAVCIGGFMGLARGPRRTCQRQRDRVGQPCRGSRKVRAPGLHHKLAHAARRHHPTMRRPQPPPSKPIANGSSAGRAGVRISRRGGARSRRWSVPHLAMVVIWCSVAVVAVLAKKWGLGTGLEACWVA